MASRSALIHKLSVVPFGTVQRADAGSRVTEEAMGCRRLWAAVLWLAVYDLSGSRHSSLVKGANRYSAEQRSARRYILSEDDAIGSARWICENLDIDFRAFQMRCLTVEGRARILKKVGKLAVTEEMDEQ